MGGAVVAALVAFEIVLTTVGALLQQGRDRNG